jgi:hypothetical protein
VASEAAWDDLTLIMRALIDLRARVDRILALLEGDDDEEEEAEGLDDA